MASVVIPTFQAGPGFDELLRRLFSQKTEFGYEVLVIDSGSTDGTPELARRHGASVHRLDPGEFDHGATRNLGASLSVGHYVVFLVQDALPVGDYWLATMVDNLAADETVAGVYSRQIPSPDSSPLTRAMMRTGPPRTRNVENSSPAARNPTRRYPRPRGARSRSSTTSAPAFDARCGSASPSKGRVSGKTSGGARPPSRLATNSCTIRVPPCCTPTNAAPSTTSGATTSTPSSSRNSSASRQPRTCHDCC